jgi:hypothetical protein
MGCDFTSGLQITVSSIHRQKHLGICLPTVGSQTWVRSCCEIFSAQVGNRTRAHGDESNPLEISMSSAMKGKPGPATGLTTLGALHPFIRAWKSGHRNLCREDRTGARAPSASYCSTEGVAPLHTAPPDPNFILFKNLFLAGSSVLATPLLMSPIYEFEGCRDKQARYQISHQSLINLTT